MKKMSTMLNLLLLTTLTFNTSYAQTPAATAAPSVAPTNVAVDPNASANANSANPQATAQINGPSGQVRKITLPLCEGVKSIPKGAYCVDESGMISTMKVNVTREYKLRNGGGGRYRHKHLSAKELKEFLARNGISFVGSDPSSKVCVTNVCTTVTNVSPNAQDNNPNVIYQDRIVYQDRPVYEKDDKNPDHYHYIDRPDSDSNPEDDYNSLKNFCGGLVDKLEDAYKNKNDIDDQVKDWEKKIADLKAREKALRGSLAECRNDCLKLAMGVDASIVACVLPADKLRALLSAADIADVDLGPQITTYYKNQTGALDIIKQNANPTDKAKACDAIFQKKECLAEIVKSGLVGCPASDEWLAIRKELLAAETALAQLLSDHAVLIAVDKKDCDINTLVDTKRGKWKDGCSIKCLERAKDTCKLALDREYRNVRVKQPYCATCGIYNDGTNGNSSGGNSGGSADAGGACMLYGTCGVSKAAQIIGALGGVVTPIGLGLMQMSMNNKSLQACTAAYAMQVQQAQVVGLPPQSPMCGMGSSGFSMMNGGSMVNPYMMGANMNPYMMNGYNPYMMNGNMMSPYSMMNQNPMFSMNMSMNPFMSGSYNPYMMNQNPMMFNPMMQGQGQFNPMMNNFNMQNGNMMNVQNQMYTSQLQMQQLAMQQMAVQNGNYASMYNNQMMMQQNPMMNMSMYGQMNPYASMYGQSTYNPYMMNQQMYNPYSYSMYNPYSMYANPYSLFSSGGVNFNAGINWGVY